MEGARLYSEATIISYRRSNFAACLCLCDCALKIFFTSIALITDTYFGRSGARVGTFLGCLAVIVPPIIFICEIVARLYNEHTILNSTNQCALLVNADFESLTRRCGIFLRLQRALGIVCFGLFD